MLRDKVLFVSHHREDSGWGRSARQYIHAIKAAGYDVSARPIRLNGRLAELDETIVEAEQTDSYGARYLIQYVLPHHMEYSGGFDKCIGMVAIDSVNLEYTGWLDRMSLMDEVWTLNTEARDYLSSVLSKPVKLLPVPCDPTVYEADYEPVPFGLPDNTVKFYTIADMNRRKNLTAILKSFHLAFPTDWPVALVIKAHQHGANPEDVFNAINEMTVKTKNALRLYPDVSHYHNEIVMSDNLSEKDVYRIHKSCDCYVSASFGEGFCIPAFDAMAFGNTVIASNTGGPKDFLKEYLIGGHSEPVFSMMGSFDNLFTAREDWFNVDIREMSIAMKKAYHDVRPNRSGINNAKQYSFDKIAEKITGNLRV